MQRPTNPRDTLKQLNKAATRQNQQTVASFLVAIAILMKRQGITKLDITPEELAFLQPGETLEPIVSLHGGIAFEFRTETPTLAKLPVPAEMKPAKKDRRK